MPKSSKEMLLLQLNRIELMRKELLEEVQSLSNETIKKSPEEGKWSIIEIIEHLILGEDYVLNGVGTTKKLTPKRRLPYHFIRYFIVMRILRSSFKVTIPTRKMAPETNSSMEELALRWQNNHQLLRSFIGTLDSNTLSNAVFFHPISGPLTPQQAINMTEAHLKRHWKQIQRIANSR